MKTALLVATGCLAISSTASAGGYLGLALGTEPGINDQFVSDVATPVGRSVRGLGGWRFGNLSLEGALNGFTVLTKHIGEQTMYQVSASVKLNLPLGDNFEGFGRVGLERTWLNLQDDGANLAGNGFLVGGGFEYRLSGILTNASIFVDYNIHHATLDATRFSKDETTRIWGLGFSIGI
ncbi:MAG TPA: outer membrane beta-barrel protein [Kofleriaceae bacterium]